MKKNYILFCILLLCISSLSFSQTQSNLSTPKGSSVTAWIVPEMSASDRAFYDNAYSSPNRTQLSYFGDGYSSSRRFNCHGYAWSIAEGGAARWIGYSVTTEEDIYMTDGSYVQVCSETYPAKVSWGSGDHSAITTSTPGRWISKWNRFPLMNHHKDDTPFGTTDYRYYVSTKVNGNESFCTGSSNVAYSVQSIPGASYTWTSSSNLTISGSGNAITVTPAAFATGAAWVEVYISTGCGTATTRKNIIIAPPPEVTGGSYTNPFPTYGDLRDGINVICGYDKYSELTVNVTPGATVTSIVPIDYSPGIMPWWSSGNQFGFDGLCCQYAWIKIRVTVSSACGINTYDYTFYTQECLPEGRTFKVFPNPASNIVSVEPDRAVAGTAKTSGGAYTAKLYNSRGTLIKTIENKSGMGMVTFNTSNLTPDFYYVQITADGKTTKKTIIIRR